MEEGADEVVALVVRAIVLLLSSVSQPSISSITGPPIPPGLAGDFACLRHFESRDDYEIDTGNGYYGAYQFDLATWQALGFSGMPNEAPAWQQDAAALALYSERGWYPWPVSSQLCGLIE